MRICIILIFTILPVVGFSQTNFDSLENVAKNTTGKDKVDVLNKLAQLYWYQSVEKSISYGDQALKLASKIQYRKGVADAYNCMGGAFYYKSDHYNAIKNFKMAFSIRKELEDIEGEIMELNNLTSIYTTLNIFEKAMQYNMQALKLSQQINDTTGMASCYYCNGEIYDHLGNFKKALYYGFKAQKLFTQLNDEGFLSSTLNNIGSTYHRLGLWDSALFYYKSSIELSKKISMPWAYAHTQANMALLHVENDQFDTAITHFHSSLAIYKRFQTVASISDCYLKLAHVYLKQQAFDSCRFYLDLSMEYKEQIKDNQTLLEAYGLYSQYYEQLDSLDKALECYKMAMQIKDSIHLQTSSKEIIDLQIEHETDKIRTEKEIERLNSLKNRNQRNFFIAFTILFLITALLLFSRFILKKRTNKLLEQKNLELETANHTKDKFFAIIAHDLKNHLVAFQNITHGLAENFYRMTEEKKHHLVQSMSHASNSLYELLENLLTWSGSQLERIEYKPEVCNVFEYVARTLETYGFNAEKKGIYLENKVNPEDEVMADPEMLKTILRNLVNNAIKFSNPNGKVIVTSKEKNNFIEISVKDQGIGISQEDIEKIFRTDMDHKNIGQSGEKGTGLGLVLCNEFVKKHQGNIWVNSTEGIGSEFVFTLPKTK